MLVTSDGHKVKVAITDLSASGSRLELTDEALAGEEVHLRLSKCGDLRAQIVWSSGSEAGGVFLDKAAFYRAAALVLAAATSSCLF